MSDDNRKLDLGDEPEERKPAISGYDYLSGSGLVRCVFTTSKTVKMGVGVNARKHESVIYWYVEQVDTESFSVRKLNTNNVPEGDSRTIPLHRLVNEFTPQLAYYEEVVLPAMEELEEMLEQGDEFREDGRLYSAEMEYDRALSMEERNVRALFGLGLIFAERKELQRTRELLVELVDVKATFDAKNQHLFNEFGIALRKTDLFSEAVVYYGRALDFVSDDENLYYNLARAHYENGDWTNCLEALIMSHRLNPDLELSRHLFKVIVGLSNDQRLLTRYNKPPVPAEVAARARQILAVEKGGLPLDEGPLRWAELSETPNGRARSGSHMDFDWTEDD